MYLNIKLELPQINFDPVLVEEHHIPSPVSAPALPPSLPVSYSSEDALQSLRRVLHKPEDNCGKSNFTLKIVTQPAKAQGGVRSPSRASSIRSDKRGRWELVFNELE